MKKINVDESTCIGCGACAAQYPENFDLDSSTGLSKVISSENASEDMAELCPIGAIHVEENKSCNCDETCECNGNCECNNEN